MATLLEGDNKGMGGLTFKRVTNTSVDIIKDFLNRAGEVAIPRDPVEAGAAAVLTAVYAFKPELAVLPGVVDTLSRKVVETVEKNQNPEEKKVGLVKALTVPVIDLLIQHVTRDESVKKAVRVTTLTPAMWSAIYQVTTNKRLF